MKLLLLATLMATSSLSFAQQGSTGAGNGGQSIYKGSNAYLRDLVEKNNCMWKKIDQIVQEEPGLNQVLEKTFTLNSSFAYRMEEEMSALGYCFTIKRLPYLQYNNSDDIHIFANQEYDQVAINDSGIVFIDLNIYSKMDSSNRSYLYMHEAAHALFNKKEERKDREPRLREFLMNVFTQIDVLVRNQNIDSFNFMIDQAKFGALEPVTVLDAKSFETIYLNDPSQSLEKKVLALKELKYSAEAKNIFSKRIMANIKDIEKQRVAMIEKTLDKTSLATTKENFSKLVSTYENLLKYVYGDKKKLEILNSAIRELIETENLTQDLVNLEKMFELFKSEKTLIPQEEKNTRLKYPAGNIAKNFDAVYGQGMFLNFIAKNPSYLEAVIFGKVAMLATYQGFQKQDDAYLNKYDPAHYSHDNILGNNESGLINMSTKEASLTSYVWNSLKSNKWLVNKIIAILEKDLTFLDQEARSRYAIPEETKSVQKVKKVSQLKFRGDELSQLIKSRQALLQKLRAI